MGPQGLPSTGADRYPDPGLAGFDVAAVRRALRRAGITGVDLELGLDVASRARFAARFLTAGNGEAWRARPYQVGSLESTARRKLHCDGRDVGKTAEIAIMAAWASVALPGRQMLIAGQCEANLSPLLDRIFRAVEETPGLAAGLVQARRSPSWHLRFANGFELWARIAGTGGVNFHGMHADWVIVDEAQNMLRASWVELFQALNAGGVLWVYGVPNGLRNTFYRLSRDPGFEQYNWPSWLNPEFTQERREELVKFYGGPTSPGYVHNVRGEHGSPERGVFDMAAFARCEAPGGVSAVVNSPEYLPHAAGAGRPVLGGDLGFCDDPTELVVYDADGGELRGVARYKLTRVDYATQQAVIQRLHEQYNFAVVALDAGHAGLAVLHGLAALGSDWADRLLAVNFGGTVPCDDVHGAPSSRPLKEVLTERLSRMMADGSITFARTPDRYLQYANHTYSFGATGRVVYSKGDDHLIDADRCAVAAVMSMNDGDGRPRPSPRVLAEPFDWGDVRGARQVRYRG